MDAWCDRPWHTPSPAWHPWLKAMSWLLIVVLSLVLLDLQSEIDRASMHQAVATLEGT